MAGIDHLECACEWPEAQMGIREETSRFPNTGHFHTEFQAALLGCSAICPTVSFDSLEGCR